MTEPSTRQIQPEDAVKTYRYLRLGIIGIVGMLGISLTEEIRGGGCLLGSISAYYYTPVKAVFIGGLIGIGFSLIVIQGKGPVEDICLNFAGMLAPVVAFVPTTGDGSCPAQHAGAARVPAATLTPELLRGAQNNIHALMWVGLIGLVVAAVLTLALNDGGPAGALTAIGGKTAATLGAVAAVLLMAFILMEVYGDRFFTYAHLVSATTMFVFLFVVVGARARANAQNETKAYVTIYSVIGLAMFGGAVGILVLGSGSLHRVFFLEATEIALFAVFWIVQTIELWEPESVPTAADPGNGLPADVPPGV